MLLVFNLHGKISVRVRKEVAAVTKISVVVAQTNDLVKKLLVLPTSDGLDRWECRHVGVAGRSLLVMMMEQLSTRFEPFGP
jgi:hypothetical protein